MFRIGNKLKEQELVNNPFRNLKSPSPPPSDSPMPPTPLPETPPPCACKTCLVKKFQKTRIDENCDCHSCNPQENCECKYCQNDHDRNCMCNDCINLRVSAHINKYDEYYEQKYFKEFNSTKVLN